MAVTRADRTLDAYLAAAARAGEPRARDALARRWQPRLIAHAWRLTGDHDLAREAVQDAWVEIITGLYRLREDRAFALWAWRITTRRCARLISGRQARRRLQAKALAEPAPAPGPDPDRGADAARIAQAMQSLPPPQRAAMWLFHIEDLSVAEIAVALDVPAGTVKTRLMHARRTLRVTLTGEDDV
ncbi:sigma-70 family RNA polymerase sigma factor [Alkalicaulis satelles]|uniref:Sigma-70 family RNA polymerase sigma factor n=1 Tax=Alkalicaulis satelles TaxID=2609175 RepID=A0A5M6ZJM4_9PROT|nr:sigma-70 family RNA polymerase sigma factor [Alkalicaulis satelles]KAA5805022.1 sigma-70 family RNA polymerase sigma factor [Alkalicaulis satelles]